MVSKYVNTNERTGPSKESRDFEKLQIRRGADHKVEPHSLNAGSGHSTSQKSCTLNSF